MFTCDEAIGRGAGSRLSLGSPANDFDDEPTTEDDPPVAPVAIGWIKVYSDGRIEAGGEALAGKVVAVEPGEGLSPSASERALLPALRGIVERLGTRRALTLLAAADRLSNAAAGAGPAMSLIRRGSGRNSDLDRIVIRILKETTKWDPTGRPFAAVVDCAAAALDEAGGGALGPWLKQRSYESLDAAIARKIGEPTDAP